MKLPEGIKVDPEIMMGKPCVKGTRIPVYVLLQKMAAGETEAELLKAYPQLNKADLMAVGNMQRGRQLKRLCSQNPECAGPFFMQKGLGESANRAVAAVDFRLIRRVGHGEFPPQA
jgi:uncharacterized protein (DUF433 family)